MKEKEITVLKVEPGKSPETVTMPNTLDAMQKLDVATHHFLHSVQSVWHGYRFW